MKNYFEGIGFAKEVPEIVLDASIYAWSKFDLSLRKEISNEYMIISTENTDNAIQFELLTGIELYSVRFDGKLIIKRAGKQLNYNSTIPTNIAMYIFVEMMKIIIHSYPLYRWKRMEKIAWQSLLYTHAL